MIQRNRYIQKLAAKRENGMVKVITGIRRCGKSCLLFGLFRQYLIEQGVNPSQIIEIALDDDTNIKLRNPLELGKHIRESIKDGSKMHYAFLDEIQNVAEIPNPYIPGGNAKIGFTDVLLGLMKIKNLDIYVTGSNSKMLSSDILTEFRGRGDEVRVRPLAYSEFYPAYPGEKRNAWRDYFTFGGMPAALPLKTAEEKSGYLHSLFAKIYLDDIMSRHGINKSRSILDSLLDITASSVGSLTNPSKIQKTFASKGIKISDDTISLYLDYFTDSFLISKAKRYDLKGRKYICSPQKYYYEDTGLRNARLNFRQQEENHIIENIIYNELCFRGYDVDVGIVPVYGRSDGGKTVKKQLETDFAANKGSARIYVQSAWHISDEEKRRQETASLLAIKDSFQKIVIVKDNIVPYHDENGIFYIGIEDFLLDENTINQ